MKANVANPRFENGQAHLRRSDHTLELYLIVIHTDSELLNFLIVSLELFKLFFIVIFVLLELVRNALIRIF